MEIGFPKPTLKKHKRETVKDSVYYSTFNRAGGRCEICGQYKNLQLHHRIFRSQDRTRINDLNNCFMLCLECHQKCHQEKKKYQNILLKVLINRQGK